MNKAFWTSVIAAATFAIVVLREWSYRSSHPYALGPSGELIALGIAGLLVSISMALATYAREAQGVAQEKRLHELFIRLETLQEELDDLHSDVLDDRILLHDQIEPEDLREWKELIDGERRDRELRAVEPEWRNELLASIDRAEILRQGILIARLEALEEFAIVQKLREAHLTDEDGPDESLA